MSSDRLSMSPASVSGEDFRRACGRFATGITIATVVDPEGSPHGLTVNSFSAVSLDPPLVSICLAHTVSLIDRFRQANAFGINILNENQRPLSDHFARKGQDRFESVSWSPGETGVPLIDGALAGIECQLVQRVPAGDHDIFIGRMVATHVTDAEPLVYFAGKYRKLQP